MTTTKIDFEFEWVKKIIDSVNSDVQIESCFRLIELYKKNNWSEEFTQDEETEFNSFVKILNQHLEIKINRYSNL